MNAMTVDTAPQARMAAGLRRVIAVALDDLDGPGSGVLELPRSICWSLERPRFDLSDRGQVRAAYKFVIDAAREPGHLIPYLNAGLLKGIWDDLGLPRGKRAAWEALNPGLRSRPAATAA